MTGLAAVRKRIEQAFEAIHGDKRSREERQADQEMLQAIQSETGTEVETVEVVETTKLSVEEQADVCIKVAMRAQYIAKSTVRRSNVHGAYVIEQVRESAEELIQQALRGLE